MGSRPGLGVLLHRRGRLLLTVISQQAHRTDPPTTVSLVLCPPKLRQRIFSTLRALLSFSNSPTAILSASIKSATTTYRDRSLTSARAASSFGFDPRSSGGHSAKLHLDAPVRGAESLAEDELVPRRLGARLELKRLLDRVIGWSEHQSIHFPSGDGPGWAVFRREVPPREATLKPRPGLASDGNGRPARPAG
jgi:hypothetical protein